VTHPDFTAALGAVARDMLRELEQTDAQQHMLAGMTLERVFCDPQLMDGPPASPLQIAIMRIAQSRPIDGVITTEECQRWFGCAAPDATARLLRRVVLICGIRGGKSTLSVAQAITAAFTVDLASVPTHEITRYPIVGPDVKRAGDTYQKLLGYMRSSPALEHYIEGEPTADTLSIKRPDGHVVEISVVAASKGGRTVRGVWLVGLTLEEAASFGSEATGAVVNAEDILKAAEPRLLPGAQAWIITSPFGPMGLVHDLYKKHFGKPDSATLVVHAPTRALNPSFPQASIDAIAKEDPDTAAREYGAEWVDADSAFLDSSLVDAAIRREPLVLGGKAHFAAIDPATRGNAWTLAVSRFDMLDSDDVQRDLPRGARPTRIVVGMQLYSTKSPLVIEVLAVKDDVATVFDVQGKRHLSTDDLLHNYALAKPFRVGGGDDDDAAQSKRVTICGVWQWIGSKKEPLRPRKVLGEIAAILLPYGVTRVCSDGWSIDSLADHARTHGLVLERFGEGSTEDVGGEKYGTLKTLVTTGLLELPPDATMRHDLLAIRKKVTANSITISLPKTPDGRHCDYAPSVALAAHLASTGKTMTFGYEAAPGANAGASSGRSRHDDDGWDDDDDRGTGNGGMF
jgi:hypothetical protein